MTDTDLHSVTWLEAADEIRARKVSPVELTRAMQTASKNVNLSFIPMRLCGRLPLDEFADISRAGASGLFGTPKSR